MTMSAMLESADALLDALDAEREKFTRRNDAEVARLIALLIERGVYPAETVPGNPNTVAVMVDGWGARWNEWRGRLTCPRCEADLRDHEHGPPFMRATLQKPEDVWHCPDCKGTWR